MDVHLVDLNRDGYLDILYASMHDDTIAWYENNKERNPSFNKQVDISRHTDCVIGIFVADLE